MVLKEIKRFIVLTGVYAIVFTVSAAAVILCVSRILFLWLRHSSAIFTPKRRELPPDCLNDPIHGEHHHIQIKVSKIKIQISPIVM